MRAPPSFFGYPIFAALVLHELCLQLWGRDDPATALPAGVVGGSPSLVFSLLSLHCVSLGTLLAQLSYKLHPFTIPSMMVSTLYQYMYEQWCTLPEPEAPKDVSSKTFLVTGSNVGLGFEASVHLAKMRPKLLVATSRDVAKCELTRKSILERSAKQETKVCSWPLELGSFQSVRAFVDTFAMDGGGTLNALVANAGVLWAGRHTWTEDGWELTLQVNYLSHALLSILLLPYLMNASSPESPSRLVFVSSFAHRFAPELKVSDLQNGILETVNQPELGNNFTRYQVSKLLGIMFIQELVSRLPESASIVACTVDPGLCDSDISRHLGKGWLYPIFKRLALGRSTEMGSRTLVHAAVASDRSMHGRYLSSCEVAKERDFLFTSEGKACSARVWDETISLLSGIDGRVSEIIARFLRVDS